MSPRVPNQKKKKSKSCIISLQNTGEVRWIAVKIYLLQENETLVFNKNKRGIKLLYQIHNCILGKRWCLYRCMQINKF